MTVVSVGAVRESASAERRVALDPVVVERLVATGHPVFIETEAGTAAGFPDASYTAAGAVVASRDSVVARSDVIAVVRTPDAPLADSLRRGQLLIGLVDPLGSAEMIAELAERGVTVAAFEKLPRTLSRAQAMDAVSSQASAAGYRAGTLAAATFDRYFPMMITASGTAKPTSVIVIGAGVAGLQAIATVKRLGANVTGYDVRPDSRAEVESLGARFLTSSISGGGGTGGYARAMTASEVAEQQDELSRTLAAFDVIITTAKVPGRTPPLLVTASTLAMMKRGSICIDLAAGEHEGNVAGSVDGQRIITDGGVLIIGAANLASDLATSSSQMYARNVLALFTSLTKDGAIVVDPDDAVHAAVVICHDGVMSDAGVSERIGAPAS